MSLRTPPFATLYTTSANDLFADFFVPALQQAIYYDRGVGDFSSGWLRQAAQGMAMRAYHAGDIVSLGRQLNRVQGSADAPMGRFASVMCLRGQQAMFEQRYEQGTSVLAGRFSVSCPQPVTLSGDWLLRCCSLCYNRESSVPSHLLVSCACWR